MQRARGFFQHGRERGDSLPVEIRAGCGFVDVDIGDGFSAEFVGELLSPLGGTGEADFLAVPTAHNDRASRAHALLRELAEGASHFHHRRRAAGGIDAAEDPCIAVIADDYPFVREVGATNPALDDVVRLDAVVHLDFEMDFHALAAETVLNRQSALPVLSIPIAWREWAVHVFEQRFGIVPGERQRYDFWRRDGLFDRNSFR